MHNAFDMVYDIYIMYIYGYNGYNVYKDIMYTWKCQVWQLWKFCYCFSRFLAAILINLITFMHEVIYTYF